MVATRSALDREVLDDMIDACHDILPIFCAPCTPGRPEELFAVAGRAAEIHLKNEISGRCEVLTLEIKAISHRAVRSAVVAHDERVWPACSAVAVRKKEPSFDGGAVGALELQSLGAAEGDFGHQGIKDVSELPFAGTVEVGNENLGGSLEPADGKCHSGHGPIEGNPADAALSFRDLFHPAIFWRNPEKMCGAANASRKVNEPAVGMPLSAGRKVIPIGSEILFLAAALRNHYEIHRPAVIEFFGNYRVERIAARRQNPAPVRRKARVRIAEVRGGCQAPGAAVQRHGPNVAPSIGALNAVRRVRSKEQPGAFAVPMHAGRPQPEPGELTFGAASCRGQENLLRRIDFRIDTIRHRPWSAVALVIKPVNHGALEAVLVALREFGLEDAFTLRRCGITHGGDPFAVRRSHRGSGASAAPSCIPSAARSAGIGDPVGRSRIDQVAAAACIEPQPSVIRPLHAGCIGTLRTYPARGRGSICANEPDLALVPVGLLDARADGERDPAAIGGKFGRGQVFDAVVVLDGERAPIYRPGNACLAALPLGPGREPGAGARQEPQQYYNRGTRALATEIIEDIHHLAASLQLPVDNGLESQVLIDFRHYRCPVMPCILHP